VCVCLCLCVCVCVCVCVNPQTTSPRLCLFVCVRVCVCMCESKTIHNYQHICSFACECVCTRVQMCSCACARCVCACVHVPNKFVLFVIFQRVPAQLAGFFVEPTDIKPTAFFDCILVCGLIGSFQQFCQTFFCMFDMGWQRLVGALNS